MENNRNLEKSAIEGVAALSPLQVGAFYPLAHPAYGLIIVDAVHGFCTPGRGPLAPTSPNAQIASMIGVIDELAQTACTRNLPILAFRDSHPEGTTEEPYPPHCVQGSGDDALVDELRWLYSHRNATVLEKNCINAVIGGMRSGSGNLVFNWITDAVQRNSIDTLVVTGICTDICVLGAVVALLSARTRGLLGNVKDILVLEPACATYDLSLETARTIGLPDSAAHPQQLYHEMGLRIMQNQGALIVR